MARPIHKINFVGKGYKWPIESLHDQSTYFNNFLYVMGPSLITGWNLLSGERKLIFSFSEPNIRQYHCHVAQLTDNLGFLVYKQMDEIRASLIRFNFEEAVYELIGDSIFLSNYEEKYAFSPIFINCYLHFNNMIFVEITYPELPEAIAYVFKLNDSLTKFTLLKTITVPEVIGFTSIYQGMFVFAVLPRLEVSRIPDTINYVCICDDNGKMIQLEDTAINFPRKINYPRNYNNYSYWLRHCWDEGRLFLLHGVDWCQNYNDRPSKRFSKVLFLIFDLNESRWSEVNLNLFSIGLVFLDLSLDDGVLSIISGDKLDDPIMYHRFPIRKPEKLSYIAMSKFEEYKLNKKKKTKLCLALNFVLNLIWPINKLF